MNKKEMIDGIKEVMVILFVVAIVVAIFYGAILLVSGEAERTGIRICERKSETSGFLTKYENSICWVQIKSDLWVRADDILRYMYLLEEK